MMDFDYRRQNWKRSPSARPPIGGMECAAPSHSRSDRAATVLIDVCHNSLGRMFVRKPEAAAALKGTAAKRLVIAAPTSVSKPIWLQVSIAGLSHTRRPCRIPHSINVRDCVLFGRLLD
jgi:hypothetical protein